MNLRVKTTDYEMTGETSGYLNDKLAALERFLNDASRCEVEVGRTAGHPHQGSIWKAEIVIIHEGARMCAIAEEESVNAAIDIAKDEILTLLKKSKGKNESKTRRAGAKLKKFARRGDMRSY